MLTTSWCRARDGAGRALQLHWLADQALREGVKAYTNWPTIPQLYIKGEFVGGADIVREMVQSGELQTHLSDQGIEVKQAATA